MELVNCDESLIQLWKSSNINAVLRNGMSDHGPVHVQITANAAYKILRLLLQGGVTPSVVADHGLQVDDSAIVVVGAALMHDLGMSVQREDHEVYGVQLAWDLLKPLLSPLYDTTTRTILTCEIMHAIIAHQMEQQCLTIEAGVVKVADALDMTQGRSRIPFEAGQVNIHSVSAHAIESVDLSAGETKPVHVDIVMNNYAGIFQLDSLLKPKLQNSSILSYVEITARILESIEKEQGIVYRL
jgi:metal-dependent HD superfamily phosphatase/phosphodiesterase